MKLKNTNDTLDLSLNKEINSQIDRKAESSSTKSSHHENKINFESLKTDLKEVKKINLY